MLLRFLLFVGLLKVRGRNRRLCRNGAIGGGNLALSDGFSVVGFEWVDDSVCALVEGVEVAPLEDRRPPLEIAAAVQMAPLEICCR